MEAARVSALRGHDVTLYERSDSCGGQINLHKKVSGRQPIEEVSHYLEKSLKKLGVPLVFNTDVTLETVKEKNPDTIIVATGSEPINKPLAGDYGPPIVLTVLDVIKEQYPVNERVLFIDSNGSHHATATAEWLADQGKKVDLVTSDLFIGVGLAPLGDLSSSRQRLLKKGVTFITDIRIERIDNSIVSGRHLYSNAKVTFDDYQTIVIDMGNRVVDRLYKSLKTHYQQVYRVGDCVAPRSIDMAIYEGRKTGEQV
jgi:hypothetical protein